MYFKEDARITDEGYLKTYNIFKVGDIAFEGNKSNDFSHGRFVENTIGDGIVSHVFVVFKPLHDTHNLRYWKYAINNESVMGRILARCTKKTTMMTNLVTKDFLNQSIPCPSAQEQDKIASLLDTISKRIELQKLYVESLKKYKRGAIDGLLSRKLHFQTTSSWREMKISELFSPISEKGYDNLTVLTIVQGVGTQPRESVERRISYDKSNTNTYKRVLENDFILHLRSFEGGLEIANSEGIVSPAYTILRAKEQIIPLFYYAYFRSYWFISNKLRIAVEGIRDGKSINMETFWNIVVPYPPIEEQKHIAEYLLCLDTKLKKAEAILDRLKAIKNGFSQQLFI